jgi:hypothetical protein
MLLINHESEILSHQMIIDFNKKNIFCCAYRQVHQNASFQVLTAASIKMAVFWDAAPCSLVDTDVSEVLTACKILARTPSGKGELFPCLTTLTHAR